MTKKLISLLLLIMFVSPALAEETIQEFSWEEIKDAGNLTGGVLIKANTLDKTPFSCLKINNITGQPMRATVLVIENPLITQNMYAISGLVRNEGVKEKGYLEMWNHFAAGQYFSRTLGKTGPMKHLEGKSGWRTFVLPFSYNGEKAGVPKKLVLNVVLPAEGLVYLGNLKLKQYGPGENPLAVRVHGAWWSGRTAGIFGAVFGCIIGLMGALIGLFTSKGQARYFVMGSMSVMLGIGIVCLLITCIALIKSQPYVVYYPLGLAGMLCTVLSIFLRGSVKKRYQQIELRKMESIDITS